MLNGAAQDIFDTSTVYLETLKTGIELLLLSSIQGTDSLTDGL